MPNDLLVSRRSFVTLALGAGAATLLATKSALAAGPSAQEVAERVQKFYDATQTFKAKFKQSYTIKVQNTKKESTGTVAFKKPGLMSFIYDKPNGNRVTSDGKEIRVYERENEQMYVSPMQKSQYPAALAFLMGEGKLTKDFTLKLLDPAQMKFESGFVLEATPKEATPAYQKTLLYVDPTTNQVLRVLILDAQGNRNRFDFSDPRVNEEIKKETFEFTPPKGTKIIKP